MKEFGRYEVIDVMERLVSYGHKASFCLEDNRCERNATKHFFCSNVMDTKGKQGKLKIASFTFFTPATYFLMNFNFWKFIWHLFDVS